MKDMLPWEEESSALIQGTGVGDMEMLEQWQHLQSQKVTGVLRSQSLQGHPTKCSHVMCPGPRLSQLGIIDLHCLGICKSLKFSHYILRFWVWSLFFSTLLLEEMRASLYTTKRETPPPNTPAFQSSFQVPVTHRQLFFILLLKHQCFLLKKDAQSK